MRARLVSADRRVCRLEPGEAKRLPRLGPPLGFYVSCPACGRLNVVLAEGQHVDEAADELRALAPGFECESPTCAKHVHVKDGEFVVSDVHA
jgi:hypothetical protein